MKLAIGLDVTIKGHRVEPSSEWQWDLWRVKLFGKLSMALHLSAETTVGPLSMRPEFFLRASMLRMLEKNYFMNPHAKLPLLNYFGLTLISVQTKMDLTAMLRMGLKQSFRFNTGFRINEAVMEFGFEKIGDAPFELISRADFDGELIPMDFVLQEGAHGYALASFGPHFLIWPWVIGYGHLQKLISFASLGGNKNPVALPLPVFNLYPAVQAGLRFSYNHSAKCVQSQPELGLSFWKWDQMARLETSRRRFNAPARGITYGFGINHADEYQIWTKKLSEAECLFGVDLGSLAEGGVCDQLREKCEKRCAARAARSGEASTSALCTCSSGSAVMQCSDEQEPYVVHPDGGIGAVVTDSAEDAFDESGVRAPRINVHELLPVCDELLTCDECASHRMCGWCASISRCVPGDYDQRPRQCHEGDWLYDTCFRDPELTITNVPAGAVWRAGALQTIEWTGRLDVPVAKVALAYRWGTADEWMLAAAIENSGSYQLRLPDALPSTDAFQVMVQALPDAAELGDDVATPAVTRELLQKYGRAYAVSPVVRVEGAIMCAGVNQEPGACVSAESCATVGGTLLYAGRRNEREGCDASGLDPTLRCCGVGKKRASALAPRVVVGMFGACPPCAAADVPMFALRSAFCIEGGQPPRELTSSADQCGNEVVPPLEKRCDALPACDALPIKFVRPGAMSSAETNIARVGEQFELAWQGGQLDADAELQVLRADACATLGGDKGWTALQTLDAYSGSNAIEWTVPDDAVAPGAPEWVRFRVQMVDNPAAPGAVRSPQSAVSSPVLLSRPAVYTVLVNGAQPSSERVSPLGGSKPIVTSESEVLPTDAGEQLVWGSMRLLGDVAQLLVPFGSESEKRGAHEIGQVTAIELTVSDAAARKALSSLAIELADGRQFSIQAPFATALYACDATTSVCSLDVTGEAVAAATDRMPKAQQCLFNDALSRLAGLEAADPELRGSETPDYIKWLAGAGAAVCFVLVALLIGAMLIKKRQSSNNY